MYLFIFLSCFCSWRRCASGSPGIEKRRISRQKVFVLASVDQRRTATQHTKKPKPNNSSKTLRRLFWYCWRAESSAASVLFPSLHRRVNATAPAFVARRRDGKWRQSEINYYRRTWCLTSELTVFVEGSAWLRCQNFLSFFKKNK